MSRQEGKVVRPFRYCLERSRLALEDELIPELRQEIIHQELSPDKAWREAKRRLQKLRATADLSQEDETLARSYWWLAKTKRDRREKFEKEIKQEEKEMGKIEEGQESHCEKKEFFLGSDNEVILKMGQNGAIWIRFFNREEARRFCCSVLSFAAGLSDERNPLESDVHPFNQITPEKLRDLMIQILEEKFGLKYLTPEETEKIKEKEKKDIEWQRMARGFRGLARPLGA